MTKDHDQATEMLVRVLNTLIDKHGFDGLHVYYPRNEIVFSGVKVFWKDYMGICIDLGLVRSSSDTAARWRVDAFTARIVYVGARKSEMEPGWQAARAEFQVLEGEDFLTHMGFCADNSDLRYTIATPHQMVTFMHQYDDAARFFGCVPIFFG